MILPWQRPLWEKLVARGQTLAHGLLLAGPAGIGKRPFALALAARLLCQAPRAEDGLACGQCASCRWRLAGNHPDFHCLRPAALIDEAGEEGSEEAGEDGEGEETGKRRSTQIVIGQLRALQAALLRTAHRGTARVAVIEPAEDMNEVAANALLKLLEEPPAGCVLILVSHRPGLLLPTVRSRCQRWTFEPPPAQAALAWLGETAPACPPALLALCGGRPLAAARLAAQGGGEQRERFLRDLCQLAASDPLRLAAQWESWLKSKEARTGGLDLARLVAWLQCWVFDLVCLKQGGAGRFFPDHRPAQQDLAAGASAAALLACYNHLVECRKLAAHPLNPRLLLEDLLMRYARNLAGIPT